METTSVRCNECGAPLQVGGSARFVTCGFCKADLEVRRDGGAFTTELVKATESLVRAASELSAHLRELKLQDELSALHERRAALEHEIRLLQSVGAPGSNEAQSRGTAAAVLLALGLAGVGFGAYFNDPLRADPSTGVLGWLASLCGAGMLLMSLMFGTGSFRDNRRRRDARARVERVRPRLAEVRLRIEQIEAEMEGMEDTGGANRAS